MVALRHRHPFRTVRRLDQLVADARQQVADDLAVVLGVLDDEDALAHSAASIISSTWTGNTTRKVEPSPSTDSTEIVPPCISTMRLEIARPSPVPPFWRVFELSICWNSPKIRSWSASAMPGPVSRTVRVNWPLAA